MDTSDTTDANTSDGRPASYVTPVITYEYLVGDFDDVYTGTYPVDYDDAVFGGESDGDRRDLRLMSTTYPNGRKIHVMYGDAGSIDDREFWGHFT